MTFIDDMKIGKEFNALLADIQHMSDEHNKGDIDVVIPVEKYQGSLKAAAQSINDMVAGHISVKKKAMACIAEFSHGNFEAPLEKFPGKKAFINENIELLRGNVKNFIDDMHRMSDEHNKGDIDVVIPVDKYQGSFKTMSQGVNDMVNGHIAVKKKAMACVAGFAAGNFEAPLEKFPGKKAFINENMEVLRGNLKALVVDANMLSKAAVEGKLDTRADASKHQGDFRKIVQGVDDTLDAVIGPLNVAAEYVDRISKGDVPAKITDNYNGDFNEIKNNLNQCIDAVNLLVIDANMLSKAAVEGKLDTRADASKHQGDFRKIVQGVDDCLDAVIGPLNVAAEYVDRISKGDIPAKITDNYNGDFNEIKNNLNTCIDSLNGLIKDMHRMSDEHNKGDIDVIMPVDKFEGAYKTMAQGVNDMVNGHIAVKKKAMACVAGFAAGNFETPLEKFPGKKAFINENMEVLRSNLKALVADANMLSKAAVEGKLDTRADASKHQGDFRKIVQGVDDTLDAVIGPLNVAAEYVDRISKGDIPAKITDNYNGDFNEIKNNLNQCIDSLNGLIKDMHRMSDEHNKGDIDVIMPVDKFEGAYKTMAQGVNDMVNGHIAVKKKAMACVAGFAAGNFETPLEKFPGKKAFINENMEVLRGNLKALVADANMLSEAAVEGKLATRADASKHQGDYRKIVQGVNDTLDSVIDPVNEAMRISEEYAKQNFSARVDENLKVRGDFIRFKKSLNNVGIQVSRAMVKVNEQVNELAAGAQEASASVEEVAAGANQIAKNAGAVSLNADRSGDGIRQVLKAMEDLSSTVQEVAGKADQVAQLAKKSEELSQKGAELANQADRGMDGITKSSTEVNEIILDIKSQMDKIGDIVVLIANLANQTNLLALNAAIEAARAGDAGRGFAVVATEVKSLAEESENSAENIRQMIGELQKQTQRAVETVEKANDGVRVGSAALTQTLDVFNKIVASIDDINKNINDVAASAEEQAASVEEVTASVNSVNALVNDTAKEATDAAAASEESSAAIDQIAKVVQNVTTIVDSVTREISAFKVTEESINLAAARDHSPSTASAQ
jgi:methyl-accepting chemotaxis protein